MATLQDVKEAFGKFFYLTNYNAIDALMGLAIANRLPGPSLSMYIIAPSGSGKSDLVNGFEQYHRAYMASKFTQSSLVSGMIDMGKKKSDGGISDKSLLVRLQAAGKSLLVLKDFTTILEMPGEARQSLMAQFREVTDGRLVSDYGHGETVAWKGKLAILAACTSAIDQLAAINNVMGERFVSFRLIGERYDLVYDKVQGATHDLESMQQEYARLVSEFLLPFDLTEAEVPIDPLVNDALKHLVAFIAHTRTGVCRNPYTKEVASIPEREGIGRIARQMQLLGSGVALARGKTTIDFEDYKLLKKVARDTIPQWRRMFMSNIFNHPGEYCAKDLSTILGMHYKTLVRHVEDLVLCGVLRQNLVSTPGQQGTSKYLYVTGEVSDHIQRSEVFTIDYLE